MSSSSDSGTANEKLPLSEGIFHHVEGHRGNQGDIVPINDPESQINESATINSIIESLHSQPFKDNFEIIVVDGDPAASTISVIADENVKTLTAPKGRASQMNAAAALAKGEILLFLHSDTILPKKALQRRESH